MYLLDELRRPANTQSRRRLRSASSTSLDVRRARLSTAVDRAFPAAVARLWNSLTSHVTAAPSLSIFCCRLKSHLFSLSCPSFWLFSHLYNCTVSAQWLVILDTIIAFTFNTKYANGYHYPVTYMVLSVCTGSREKDKFPDESTSRYAGHSVQRHGGPGATEQLLGA